MRYMFDHSHITGDCFQRWEDDFGIKEMMERPHRLRVELKCAELIAPDVIPIAKKRAYLMAVTEIRGADWPAVINVLYKTKAEGVQAQNDITEAYNAVEGGNFPDIGGISNIDQYWQEQEDAS